MNHLTSTSSKGSRCWSQHGTESTLVENLPITITCNHYFPLSSFHTFKPHGFFFFQNIKNIVTERGMRQVDATQ